ncbi:MAG: NTP transferase domain-containing protein [Dehalococcoidales bacterium]|nr:NTP transferase domain-containing protein [Dehalococcoidales bacterium]
MSYALDNVQIVVLAGGLATRLGDLAQNRPKSMVNINGKPFLQHQLELFKRQGIFRVLICLGHLGEQIESHFGDGNHFGIDITYSYENKPLGTAGALKNAGRFLDDIFFTIYGDSYVFLNFSDAWHYFQSNNKLALMTVYKNNNLFDTSNTVIRGDHVLKYNKHEKAADMNYIEYGVNIFRKDIMSGIPEDSFYELGDVFTPLIEEEQLLAYEVKERFYEIGSPKGIEEFKKFIGGET